MNQIYHFSFFLVFLFMGCSSAAQQAPTEASDGQITVDNFKIELAKIKQAQLVDVRTPGEYVKGHLEAAQNINFNDPNFELQIGQLDKSQPVFIYCQSGLRSAKAYEKMKAMGFSTVYDMEGGYRNWAKE